MIQTIFPKWIKFSWLGFALIGFIDATYLTVIYLSGNSLTCTVVHGCNEVLSSSYSSIGPVPLSLLGALYYLVMLLGIIFVLDRGSVKILKLLSYFSIAGFVMSGWLFFVQWRVVEAFCQYCLLSAITSTVLFVFGMIILRRININSKLTSSSL